MTKITFLDTGTFPADFEFTRPAFAHNWQTFKETSPENTIAHLKGAAIAITNKVKIPGDVMAALPNLKMVAIAATGYDHIDIEEARKRSIIVSNIRGYAVNSVPEHVIALIISLSRSIKGYNRDIESGAWQNQKQFCFFTHPIEDLAGKTLGLIGRGSIGESLARLAGCFGMRVITAARKNQSSLEKDRTPFPEVLAQADIISLHCPLNEETRNLITMEEFAQMKQRPILINTARGGIVNEVDAATALKKGMISALGVDCLSTEPPAPDNPLLAIAERDNVIITPHVAWASRTAIDTLWQQLIENIESFHKGTPQNNVY